MLIAGSDNMLAGKSDWEWGWGGLRFLIGRWGEAAVIATTLLYGLEYMIRATSPICWSVIQATFLDKILMEGI